MKPITRTTQDARDITIARLRTTVLQRHRAHLAAQHALWDCLRSPLSTIAEATAAIAASAAARDAERAARDALSYLEHQQWHLKQSNE